MQSEIEKLPKYIAYILISLIVTLLLSWFIPRIVIDTNLKRFEGEPRIFAIHALLEAQRRVGGSLQGLTITKRKVVSVKQLEDSEYVCEATAGNDYAYPTKNRYEAIIQEYTIFGFPYASIQVTCSDARRL